MRRPLVQYPDPSLHSIAKPIEKIDDDIRSLLSDMAETMYAEDGVGLAAPQVGVGLRAVVVDVSQAPGESPNGLIKMVNPEIISREGEVDYEEGCLSVPGFRVTMRRAKRVKVHYLDETGAHRELDTDGLLAIAIQQEIDHLDGRLIIDWVSRLKQDMYLQELKKRAKGEEDR